MSDHNTLEIIWGVRLLDEGFLGIPNIIVRNYRHLNIEHGEFGFICTVLTYKHDARDPYPGQDTLAKHLKCNERQIRKWIESLESKGLILVGRRRNKDNKTYGNNVYNFRPLIEKALELIGEKPLPPSNEDYDVEYKNPQEPEVPMGMQKPEVPEVPVARKGPEDPVVPEPEVRGSGPEVPQNNSFNRSLEYNLYNPVILKEELTQRLQQHFSATAFETWFAGMEVIGLEEGILFISLPTSFQADWVRDRYAKLILEKTEELNLEVVVVNVTARDK